ncbi:MAG: hypothetical protein V4678_01430 [Patescibacteria group bacterium]
MAPSDNVFDLVLTALRSQQPVYTAPDQPQQVFAKLGLSTPERPVQIIQTLVASGEIVVGREDDDPNGDHKRPAKKFCDSYRVR